MLQGGHDVLGGRDCGKQPLGGVVVRRPWGGLLQPCAQAPHSCWTWATGCGLHWCLSVLFFPPLSGTGWLQAAGVEHFHPPDPLTVLLRRIE